MNVDTNTVRADPLPSTAAPVIPLAWRTRETTRHLLQAYIGGFGISLATGALLWLDLGSANLKQVMLVTHLVAGTLGLMFFAVYLFAHLKDGREPWRTLLFPLRLIPELRREPFAWKRLHGHALMWTNGLLLFSGLLMSLPAVWYLSGKPETLPYGMSHRLLLVHDWATPLALALMVLHFPAREKRS